LGVALTGKTNLGLDGNRQSWLEDPDGNRIVNMQMVAVNMREIAKVWLSA
jgi:lactoylglutathione lyase